MDSATDRLERYRAIAAQATQDALAFPTSAELCLRIKRLLDDPNCALDRVAKLVQAEPLLAARVVAMANSIVYNRAGRQIADIRVAVTRLGLRTLRSLALSQLVRQLANQPSDPRLQQLARLLWEHTANASALAFVLARRVTHQDPEAALFAALLHEVAGFYLIAHAAAVPEWQGGPPPDWQDEGEVVVGRALLVQLEVPTEIRTAIEEMWEGYLAIPPVSLGDTLLLAEALAPIPSPLYWRPEGADAAGRSRIEIVLDRETLSSILAESAAEVRSLTEALQ